MWALLVVGALSIAALEFDAQPLSGPAYSGKLVALSSEKLVLTTAEGEKVINLNNLLALVPCSLPAAPQESAPIQISLVDGSLAAAKTYTVNNSSAQMTLLNASSIKIPVRSIASVRWKTNPTIYDQPWEKIKQTEAAGDLVVIRKPESLDYYEGLLFDVVPETIQFEFDGSRIDIRSSKVEGLIYFHASQQEFPSPVCRVTTAGGSIWNAKALLLTDDHLKITTSTGLKVELQLENIRKFDFSVGKIVYLSDLTPDSIKWLPYFGTGPINNQLLQLFRPRNNRSFTNDKLSIFKKQYEKGLSLHSRTTLVYRLPDNYNRFLADVGIDDRVREAGHVRLVISGDGKLLFESNVSGQDKEPLHLNIAIKGVRRLTILVDYGDGLDIGDHLNLCNARITK